MTSKALPSDSKASLPKRVTPGDEDFDVERYNEIARVARLREVRLFESDYSLKLNFLSDIECYESRDAVYMFVGKCKHVALSESGVCIGVFAWTADVKVGRTKALKASAEYIVVYSELEGRDEEYVKLFFEKVGKFTSFPYFRSHVAHLTSASALHLPPLPSLTDRVD